jgi:hypothetical protein
LGPIERTAAPTLAEGAVIAEIGGSLIAGAKVSVVLGISFSIGICSSVSSTVICDMGVPEETVGGTIVLQPGEWMLALTPPALDKAVKTLRGEITLPAVIRVPTGGGVEAARA